MDTCPCSEGTKEQNEMPTVRNLYTSSGEITQNGPDL